MITPRWIFLKMGEFSDTTVLKIEKCVYIEHVIPKNLSVCEKMWGNTLYRYTGHIWQYESV